MVTVPGAAQDRGADAGAGRRHRLDDRWACRRRRLVHLRFEARPGLVVGQVFCGSEYCRTRRLASLVWIC